VVSGPDERGTVITDGVPHLLGWERHGRQIRFVSLTSIAPCGHRDVIDVTGLDSAALEFLCNECRTIHTVPRPDPVRPAASTTAGARGIPDRGRP
jgi:hypothetical protein